MTQPELPTLEVTLDDVRELVEPVAARGMPGVWTIDDEIRERMEVQRG